MEKQRIRHHGTGEIMEWDPGQPLPQGEWVVDDSSKVVFPEWFGAVPDQGILKDMMSSGPASIS
jgi:hypothetical protein